jgi:hypothetical protein
MVRLSLERIPFQTTGNGFRPPPPSTAFSKITNLKVPEVLGGKRHEIDDDPHP